MGTQKRIVWNNNNYANLYEQCLPLLEIIEFMNIIINKLNIFEHNFFLKKRVNNVNVK